MCTVEKNFNNLNFNLVLNYQQNITTHDKWTKTEKILSVKPKHLITRKLPPCKVMKLSTFIRTMFKTESPTAYLK